MKQSTFRRSVSGSPPGKRCRTKAGAFLCPRLKTAKQTYLLGEALPPLFVRAEPRYKACMSMDLPGGTEPALSDAELEELSLEMPALALLRDFARLLPDIAWFGQLGTPLDQETRTLAHGYLEGLGFPDADMAKLSNWEDATAAAESGDWNSAAWEAEESLRAALSTDLLDVLSEEAFEIGFTYVAAQADEAVRNAAEATANDWGVEDMEIAIAAAGAAMQAVHGAAIAVAAGADDNHPFLLRFRLFERGRWPIGIAGLTFNIF